MADTNNIKIEEMDCWAVDDWAAFGISLWSLQKNIKEDPAYISEAIDILVGIGKVLPKLSPIMCKYAGDVADMVAGLCCDCIREMAEDCHWEARQVGQSHPDTDTSDDDPPDDESALDLPPEWFDGLDDDDGDD